MSFEFSSTASSTATRVLAATKSMISAYAHNTRLQSLVSAPTPQRMAKGTVRLSGVDRKVIRAAHDAEGDVLSKYETLAPAAVCALRDHIEKRIRFEQGSLALNGYEHKVDASPAFDVDPNDEAAELFNMEKGFDHRMRAAIEALTQAIVDRTLAPCPFETFIGRWLFAGVGLKTTKEELMVQTLEWMAKQLE